MSHTSLPGSLALLAVFVCLLLPSVVHAQSGVLRGRVVDAVTQEPLPGVNVLVEGTARGAATDVDGAFEVDGLAPGAYAVRATFLGYAPQTKTDVVVQPSRATFVEFRLQEAAVSLEGVEVTASPFSAPPDAPTSVQTLGAEEIRRTPGGQNDISRTLLSLPGVSGGVDVRSDLLVRGGGPSENAYYVDGIRVPQINHFATQGAGGGALGLLNVDFIRETEFYTGGYPVRYGDAASSVLLVRNRPGSPERLAGDFTLGASEAALTLDGAVGEDANWLFSVRRSYLQFLFELLGLPIRPAYWDAQTRIELNPTGRDRVVLVGLGAIDDFDIVQPEDDDFEAQETVRRVLDNDQRSYTVGGSWRRLVPGGFLTLAASRSRQDFRFADVGDDGEDVLRNRSVETEHRLRLDADLRLARRLTLGTGGGVVRGGAETDFFERARAGTSFIEDLRFASDLALWKGFVYGQLTARALGDRLTSTAGVRLDAASFLDRALYPAPRVSASYALASAWTVNAAAGLFTQSPAYLSLVVRDADGAYVNRGLPYVHVRQYVGGVAWTPRAALRLTAEGYFKQYRDYPVSAGDPRVSLANVGDDFGFVGAEPLRGVGRGRAYGLELLAQRKRTGRAYALAAYTLGWSEFSGADGRLRPSAWDVRHNVSLTGGYRIGRAWEIGLKWRFLSGRPFTPFDPVASAEAYALTGRGVPDLDRLNEERTPAYHRLDLRVDRRFTFNRWNAVLYLDVQNVYNRRNVFGFDYTENPAEPDGLRTTENVGLLPNIGFSIEF